MRHDTSIAPQLSAANKLYLYALLSRELGCGKQTFATRVEEALASDRMTADDLGFTDTRALLDALSEFIELKVFKGGRLYATVIAQPDWDAALAAPETAKDSSAKNGKPWKRKKGAKTLKPARPKRVKRSVEPTSTTPEAAGRATAPETEPADSAPSTPATEPVPAPEPMVAAELNQSECENVPVVADEPAPAPEDSESPAEPAGAEKQATDAAAPAPDERPAIALTVTYDPYTGRDEEVTLTATKRAVPDAPATSPKAPVATPEQEKGNDPTPAPVAAPSTRPQRTEPVASKPPVKRRPADALLTTAPSALALKGYPRDFETDVHVPGALLSLLARIVPVGANPLATLTEDFRVARGLNTASGNRTHATFSLRYQGANGKPVLAGIKRNPGPGAPWVLATLDHVDEELLAQTGIEGLATRLDDPRQQALFQLGLHVRLETEALERLAAAAYPAVWTADSLRVQLAFAYARTGADASFPTGLFTADGTPLLAELEAADDDIPWKLV